MCATGSDALFRIGWPRAFISSTDDWTKNAGGLVCIPAQHGQSPAAGRRCDQHVSRVYPTLELTGSP
jgi:hypothetical protein